MDIDNVSRSSRGKSPVGEGDWGDENEGSGSRSLKQIKRVESLRKMMEALDAISCAAVVAPSANVSPEVGLQSMESNISFLGEQELSTTPRAGVITQNL